MAAQPRKDLKAVPSVRDAAAAAKQTTPQPAADGESLDTFNAVAGAVPAGAAGEATSVKAAAADARNPFTTQDERLIRVLPPADDVPESPAATARLGIAEATGAAAAAEEVQRAAEARQEPALSQFPRSSEPGADSDSSATEISATSATSAASAAGAVREAARQRLDPAISRDFTVDQPGVTTEAPAAYADRLGISADEMLERLNPDIVGRDAGIGEQQDVPAAFQNSGRDALAAQVDAVFDLGDDTGASAGTAGGVVSAGGAGGAFGRMGTPEDLGVTGDLGPRAGLNAGNSGAGMDLFNVGLPNRGVSGAANELGLMQGYLDSVDSTASSPSVAIKPGVKVTQIDTVPDGAPVETVPDGKPATSTVPQPPPTIVVDELLKKATETLEAAAPYLVTGAIIAGTAAAIVAAPALAIPAAAAVLLTVTGPDGSGAGEGTVPDASNPGPDGDVGGQPTSGEMAVRTAMRDRLNYRPMLPGEGATDPADNAEDVPGGPPVGLAQAGMANKAITEFLVGQPGEGVVRGSGSIDFGRLPGDMGNIDYGPDSTGAWSGNTLTEGEADALNSLGGSGLSISDLHNTSDDSSDDQDDADDAS